MKVFREFREFILRGNVVDLAIGVVIGAAFGGVVKSFVSDLITPLIGIFGSFSFPSWSVKIHGSDFLLGDFINTVISFLIVSAVVFFFVVQPVNALMKRVYHEKAADPTTRECPFCYSSISMKATRCGFCTSEVEAVEMARGGEDTPKVKASPLGVALGVAKNLKLPKE